MYSHYHRKIDYIRKAVKGPTADELIEIRLWDEFGRVPNFVAFFLFFFFCDVSNIYYYPGHSV